VTHKKTENWKGGESNLEQGKDKWERAKPTRPLKTTRAYKYNNGKGGERKRCGWHGKELSPEGRTTKGKETSKD